MDDTTPFLPSPTDPYPSRPAWAQRELLPGADSWLGYWIIVGVFLIHAFLVRPDRSYLVSENLLWECAMHVFLLVGPPCAVYLGVRHLVRGGRSPLCWVSVPLGVFLSAMTFVGLVAAA